MPALIPATMPVAETEATDGLLLAHVPPLTLSVNVADVPVQSDGVPLIAAALGAGFTIMLVVAKAVPQVVITM